MEWLFLGFCVFFLVCNTGLLNRIEKLEEEVRNLKANHK